MTRPIWVIEKDTAHGSSLRLTVGVPGVPGSHTVGGLSRDQGASLEVALLALEERAKSRALSQVRDALGIS